MYKYSRKEKYEEYLDTTIIYWRNKPYYSAEDIRNIMSDLLAKKPSAVKGKKFTPKWNIQLSDCCQYITKVVGDETKHYECMKCGKPCDVDTSKKEKCEHICSDCGSQSFSCDSCGEHLPDHPSKPRIEPLDLTLKGGGGSYASQVGETFLMVKDKVNEIITLLNSEK
jgi:DNA-directed RNA polymerase subunit RPC12/RpoP